MATYQNIGQGSSMGDDKAGRKGSNPGSVQPQLPAEFTIVIRDLLSPPIKQSFSINDFRQFCYAITGLVALFCNVKQIFYTNEQGQPTKRRTIIITNQIFRNFMHNKSMDEISRQLYPDLPRPRPNKPGPSSEATAQYLPSNVYLNPDLSVSFASKVANLPRPHQTVHQSQYGAQFLYPLGPASSNDTQIESHKYKDPFPLLKIPKSRFSTRGLSESFPPGQFSCFQLPTVQTLSFHVPEYHQPPKAMFANDLLNMIMDPGKSTLLIVCEKKVNSNDN